MRLLFELQLADPLNATASQLQARCLTALGRDSEAKDLLFQAMRFQPKSAALMFSLARILDTPEEVEEFYSLWLRTRTDEASYLKTVRTVMTACSRGRSFDFAVMITRDATRRLLKTRGKVSVDVRDRALGFADGERALRDVIAELIKHEIPHFLAAGTALGAVREGRLLSFDTDIDIGIYEENFDKAKLVSLFERSANFRIQDADKTSPKVGLQHWNGVFIDLFTFFRKEGKIWHSGAFTEWWNTPFELQKIRLYDLDVQIPEPSDQYLTECYDGWRVPNATFDAFFEGPNARVYWPEYFDLYIHRKVFELVALKQYGRILDYARHFPDKFDWLNLKEIQALADKQTARLAAQAAAQAAAAEAAIAEAVQDIDDQNQPAPNPDGDTEGQT